MVHRLLASACAASALLLLAATPAASADRPSDQRLSAAVDDYVGEYVDRNGLPGAAVAVTRDGETVHEAGYGHDSTGADITPDTPMRIASVTKSMTAFAVLQLVDEGRVDLDAPVRRYLPDVSMADDRFDRVTVRQLLSHTSGIATPTILGPADTLVEGVERLRDVELAADPGARYQYSNANAWLAALLVQEVRGEPFTTVLRERIFAPLGMTDTSANVSSAEAVPRMPDGHVTAYGRAFATREPVQMFAGADGVVSTAHDMSAWLAMQQRGGITATGERLLALRLVEESHRPQPGGARAGLGWQLSRSDDPQRISHSGVDATFNAQQDLVPSSGYGVVVMLPSGTITREHAYAISTGIIDLTEGRDASVGVPVPTYIDLGLGVLAVGAVAGGVLGVRRSVRWSRRRAHSAWWAFGARLLPVALVPVLAVLLFGVAPSLQGNSLTPVDVLRLAPAAAVLLLVVALSCAAVLVARVVGRGSPDDNARAT